MHYRVKPDSEHPAHDCFRCGELHHRKAPWCAGCYREYVARGKRVAPGKPPPPPAGFDVRDLANGKPLG